MDISKPPQHSDIKFRAVCGLGTELRLGKSGSGPVGDHPKVSWGVQGWPRQTCTGVWTFKEGKHWWDLVESSSELPCGAGHLQLLCPGPGFRANKISISA